MLKSGFTILAATLLLGRARRRQISPVPVPLPSRVWWPRMRRPWPAINGS
jgi:hypothetical protein